jgi:hypothetical protein
MRKSVRVTAAVLVSVSALILAACTVFDALGPTGARGVTFTYAGDTLLNVGDIVPIPVTVSVDGVLLPPQRLRVAITPDSTRVTLNATGDSLVACRAGQASLLVQLLHSSAAGTSIPDTTIGLHVSGGAPPGSRCP